MLIFFSSQLEHLLCIFASFLLKERVSARDTGFNKTDSPSRNLIPLEGYCEWSDSAGSSKSNFFPSDRFCDSMERSM